MLMTRRPDLVVPNHTRQFPSDPCIYKHGRICRQIGKDLLRGAVEQLRQACWRHLVQEGCVRDLHKSSRVSRWATKSYAYSTVPPSVTKYLGRYHPSTSGYAVYRG